MPLLHNDTNIEQLKINKFEKLEDFSAAKEAGLIDNTEISFIEEAMQADWTQTDTNAPDYIKNVPENITFFSEDTGESVVPLDGIKTEVIQVSSTMQIKPDIVTVISGSVTSQTLELVVPNDNLAHVWDIFLSTGNSVSITISAGNNAQILYPLNFMWSGNTDIELSIVGFGMSKYYVRYGEFN